MKKIVITAVLFTLLFQNITAEVFEAKVEGIKITLLNILMKKAFSSPMGDSSPNKLLNLADGLEPEDLGSITVQEADQDAFEMSFDFSNVRIPVKAWAADGAGTYYFTTAAGIGESDSEDSSTWTDYDYWTAPQILPERTDGRVVVQSYFPEPAFIAAGQVFTVTSLVDLDFCVLFWDGVEASGLFLYNSEEYPSGYKAFGLDVPDVVLALDTELEVERYALATSQSNLDSGNLDLYTVVSLFFDSTSQNLYDGAVKKNTGYNSGLPGIQRAGPADRNQDNTYNLAFARNYSESDGIYIVDTGTDGTFTRSSPGDASETMVMYDPTSGSDVGMTIHYRRLED